MKCEKCKHYKVAPYGEPCDSCSEFIYFEPITNADRIRAMSDEELAEELYDNSNIDCTQYQTILDWLKREVEQ